VKGIGDPAVWAKSERAVGLGCRQHLRPWLKREGSAKRCRQHYATAVADRDYFYMGHRYVVYHWASACPAYGPCVPR